MKRNRKEGIKMKKYEVIREAFSNCSGKAQTFFEETETDNLDDYVQEHIQPGSEWARIQNDNGSIVYEVSLCGIRTKFIFTEID